MRCRIEVYEIADSLAGCHAGPLHNDVEEQCLIVGLYTLLPHLFFAPVHSIHNTKDVQSSNLG